ncbi:MAG: flagellin [Oligoflexales bacterium]
MGVRIKTNVASLAAQRAMEGNRRDLGNSLDRLSSGMRINKSADDAAGLAVSERIRAKIASLGVAKRNANDGVSYIQVAEGGLNEITNIVVRMRELAAQSASDTLGNRERGFLDKEFQQLTAEVARIQASTEFNGTKLLEKSDDQKPLQIFVGATNRGNDMDGNAPDIPTDNDPDVMTVDLTQLESLTEAIGNVTSTGLTIVPPEDGGAQDLGPDGTHDLFNKLDTCLDSVASYRATLGSIQSRLQSTITNIDISEENLNAARSRIRDVDYAAESTKFTQAQILSSAGASVLMQANQMPEVVLQLLRG